MNNLKYLISKLSFLKVFNSPFKTPIPKLYIGKVKMGVPYFLPRTFVKMTDKELIQKATERYEKMDGKLSLEKCVQTQSKYKQIQKIIGFDIVGLGWKTKWDSYRFEYGPVWSFVFFGIQIVIWFYVPEEDHYWECWLNYIYETDKTKSVTERLIEAKQKEPCIWNSYDDKNNKIQICYWDVILKKKYLDISK